MPCVTSRELGQCNGQAPASSKAHGRFAPEISAGSLQRVDLSSPEGLGKAVEAVQKRLPFIMTSAWLLVPAAKRWDLSHFREAFGKPGSAVQVLRAEAHARRYSYFRDREGDVCLHEARAINERMLMPFHKFEQLAHREPSGCYYMQTQVAERTGKQMTTRGDRAVLEELQAAMSTGPLRRLADHLGPWVASLLYLGPSGTLTPAHHDAYDNVFLQLLGRKSFLLLDPPAGAAGLRPLPSHHRYEWRSPIDLECPGEGDLRGLRGRGCEAVLAPGEALFVPSGWWHHVTALGDGGGGAGAGLSVASLNFWFDEWTGLLGRPRLPLPPGLESELARQAEQLLGDSLGLARIAEAVASLHEEVGSPAAAGVGSLRADGELLKAQNFLLHGLARILGPRAVKGFVQEYLYPDRWRSVCSDPRAAPWESPEESLRSDPGIPA